MLHINTQHCVLVRHCPFPPFFPTSGGKQERFQPFQLGGTDTEHEGAPAKNGASPAVHRVPFQIPRGRCEHRETDGQYRVDLTRTVGHIKNLILAFESKQTGKLDKSDLDLRNLVFRGLISSRCPKKWKGVETSFLRP